MQGRAKQLDPFKDNLYRRATDPATGENVIEKSCPKCSKKAGQTMYYPESEYAKKTTRTGAIDTEKDCPRHRRAPAATASTEVSNSAH